MSEERGDSRLVEGRLAGCIEVGGTVETDKRVGPALNLSRPMVIIIMMITTAIIISVSFYT